MHFEVEQKFPVEDQAALELRLREIGAREVRAVEQADRYFNHPSRDFAQTDEALRLRQVGDTNFITYKGPKLDATTKTRREIELPLPSGNAAVAGFAELLTALGFQSVGEVRKRRRILQINWEGRNIEGALDEVFGLGTFIELELTAGEEEVESAKLAIASLAAALRLAHSERRSYLELLLANR